MITYNHSKYISKAIQGVVNQECKFEYELIIGDDCSIDKTREICIEYQNKFPNKIKLLLHEKNLGGEGRNNFISTLKQCDGKYVALCEGDDYWTDPNKLQKQVDFLEANPEYNICFHRVYYKLDEQENLVLSQLNTSEKEETYSIEDLSKENIIHTPSVVFRNGLIENFPSWFYEAAVGDYVLHMLNAKKGKIKYFPEPMAVYRIHSGGIWGQKNIGETHPKWIKLLDNLMCENFQPEIIENLLQQKNRKLKEYILWLLSEKKFSFIETTVRKYFNKNEVQDLSLLTDTFITYISYLDNQIQGIKKSKSYLLASKLSRFKHKGLQKFLRT